MYIIISFLVPYKLKSLKIPDSSPGPRVSHPDKSIIHLWYPIRFQRLHGTDIIWSIYLALGLANSGFNVHLPRPFRPLSSTAIVLSISLNSADRCGVVQNRLNWSISILV